MSRRNLVYPSQSLPNFKAEARTNEPVNLRLQPTAAGAILGRRG